MRTLGGGVNPSVTCGDSSPIGEPFLAVLCFAVVCHRVLIVRKDGRKMKNGEHTMPVPRHIAIIMDGNGRWAKNGAYPAQRVMPPVRRRFAVLLTTAAPWVWNI